MLTIYLTVTNFISFILFGLDKYRARHRLFRIPEKMLFMTAIAGGTAGALAGMYIFHHKTRHITFTIGMPVIMLVQIWLYFAITDKQAWFMNLVTGF